MDAEDLITAVRSLPDDLQALLAGLDRGDMRRRPGDDAWSPLEICCHLRDSAQIWGHRIQRFLTEENPSLEPYDQEALARDRDYQSEDPAKALTAFRAYWGGLAYQLERLAPPEWSRTAVHPRRGRITLLEGVELLVEHGREHLDQIRRTTQPRH